MKKPLIENDTKTGLTLVEKAVVSQMNQLQSGPCLRAEELIELAEQGLRCPDYDARIDHVARCPYCHALLKSLREVEVIYQQSQPSWLQKLFNWNFKIESGTVYEGACRLPKWSFRYLELLAQEPVLAPAYRSATAAPTSPIRLISPSPGNRALVETRPLFEWTPVPQASGYEVQLEVQDKIFRVIPNALTVEGTTARLNPSIELQRGMTYRLRIRPLLQAGETAFAAAPREAVYTFKVLTEQGRHRREWARNHAAQAPFSSAMVLYDLGLYVEAMEVVKQWPHERQADRWAEVIEQSLTMRQADPARMK